jgi:hypothetical protein
MTLPVIPWPGGKRVPHAKQLQSGSRTATTDCGLCSLVMALQVVSGPALRVPRERLSSWIAALRTQMTPPPFWPATTLPNHEQAAESRLVDGAYLAVGRAPTSASYLVLPHGIVVEHLRRGSAVIVGIDYGRLNDLMPRLSGSTTFRGGHYVVLWGYEAQGGVAWTRLGDPLHDGRRPGIPRGWQTVRVLRYLRAAETFGVPDAGKGRAKVCIVRETKER